MSLVRCSQCEVDFLPKYPEWLRLMHMLEFLHAQELISKAMYDSCMGSLMSVKYAVDLLDEQREARERKETEEYYKDKSNRKQRKPGERK